MNLTLLFGLLGGLLVLAFLANRLARYTGVPDVLVLMLTGVILGPVLRLVEASRFTGATHAFGTLALILILFEAGLDLRLHEMVRHFAGGFLLALLSYGLAAVAIAGVSMRLLHLPLASALLVGAVLGGVSSSVTLPVLQQFELRAVLKTPLIVEGSLSDIFAVVAVSTLLGLPQASVVWSEMLHGLLYYVCVALVVGALAGIAWTLLLPKLSDQRFWQVLTLAVVLLLYAGTEAVHAGGLFAVVIFGLVLSNFPTRGGRAIEDVLLPGVFQPNHSAQILAFHSELSFLVRTFFFVLIGVIIQFAGLRRYALPPAAIVIAIYVSRWLGVHLSRVFWRGSHAREREFALWLVPRGLITAVLAFEVLARRGPDFRFLVTLAFALQLARIIYRRKFLAVAGSWVGGVIFLVPDSSNALDAALAVIFFTVATVALVGFGVLAATTVLFVGLPPISNLPVTFDPSQWYFSNSIIALSLLLAIVFYAFCCARAAAA